MDCDSNNIPSGGIFSAAVSASPVDDNKKINRISALAWVAIAAVATFFGSLIFGASIPTACVITVLTGVGVGIYKAKESKSDNIGYEESLAYVDVSENMMENVERAEAKIAEIRKMNDDAKREAVEKYQKMRTETDEKLAKIQLDRENEPKRRLEIQEKLRKKQKELEEYIKNNIVTECDIDKLDIELNIQGLNSELINLDRESKLYGAHEESLKLALKSFLEFHKTLLGDFQPEED